MKALLVMLAVLLSGGAVANETVSICYNYGCLSHASIHYSDAELAQIAGQIAATTTPAAERAAIAKAVGELYHWAGQQSPISADRAGDRLDMGVNGKMDCIDHATSTTALLQMMARRGMLHFYKVLPEQRRTRFIFQHFSAAIEEVQPPPRAAPVAAPVKIPDYMPVMLALCDCRDLMNDLPKPPPPPASPGIHPGARYVVDSWFVEQGEPAVVLPLDAWLDGEGPNVY